MTLLKRLILVAAAIGVAVTLIYQFVVARSDQNPGRIRVSGNIEVTDAEVAFKIPGRVKTRLVDEGERVEQGQLVAELESADIQSELALRKAERDAAKWAYDELLAGSRPEEKQAAEAAMQKAQAALDELLHGSREQEKAAAADRVRKAQAELDRAEKELGRATDLYERKVMPQEQYDMAVAAYKVAEAQLREATAQRDLVDIGPRQEVIQQARKAMEQATAQYELVRIGPRAETKEQAKARLEQAEAAVRLAETRLSYAKVFSPLTGWVLSKNVEPGEYVAPGTPVVTVGDLVNVWLRAYINEDDNGRVKLGQTARVTTDTYPGKVYEGRVSFISPQAEFTPKNVQTEKERVKLVYRIKIDINNIDMELNPGMPADAEIVLGRKAEGGSGGKLE